MYPWKTASAVQKTSQEIARIAFIASQHSFHIVVDDYGWVRLSKDGRLDGSMPLNTLECASEISEEYVIQEIETLSKR